MDKKEFEKEIEKNIKNMGYIDGEKLSPEGEILKKLYLEHKSIGIEVNEKIISNEVEIIYENRLKKESEKLNIDINQIKVLISTIGVVNEKIKTILDESTVEKNLRVFTKIEKIYIFHTESSKEHFEKSLENFKINDKKSKVKDVRVVVEIDKSQAYRVYDECSEENISKMGNGNFEIIMEYPENEWVYGYLLSFGEYLKVKEPKRIKKILFEKIEKMKENYK